MTESLVDDSETLSPAARGVFQIEAGAILAEELHQRLIQLEAFLAEGDTKNVQDLVYGIVNVIRRDAGRESVPIH